MQAAPGGGLWAPGPCGPASSLLGQLLLQHQGRSPPNTWSGRAPGSGFVFYSSVRPQPETAIISRTPSSTGRRDAILASCTLLSQQHHCRQGPGPAPSPPQPEDSLGCRCILPKIPRVHFCKTLLLPRDSCAHTSRDGGQEDQSGRASTATQCQGGVREGFTLQEPSQGGCWAAVVVAGQEGLHPRDLQRRLGERAPRVHSGPPWLPHHRPPQSTLSLPTPVTCALHYKTIIFAVTFF